MNKGQTYALHQFLYIPMMKISAPDFDRFEGVNIHRRHPLLNQLHSPC